MNRDSFMCTVSDSDEHADLENVIDPHVNNVWSLYLVYPPTTTINFRCCTVYMLKTRSINEFNRISLVQVVCIVMPLMAFASVAGHSIVNTYFYPLQGYPGS